MKSESLRNVVRVKSKWNQSERTVKPTWVRNEIEMGEILNIFCLELTLAHDSLIIANALIISIGIIWLPILKFLSDLCVCAPQKFSLETAILPILSCSIRFFLLIDKVLYYLLAKHERNVLNFKKL